jgi:putative membrane protein
MIRGLIKHIIINTGSLYLVSVLVNGIVFVGGINTLFLTGAVLTLATLIIKPIINILLLPLNLITFGLFRWIAFTLTFYLVTLLVPGFKLLDFSFSGYSSHWLSIPPVYFSGILAFIAFSFAVSFITSIAYWIFK